MPRATYLVKGDPVLKPSFISLQSACLYLSILPVSRQSCAACNQLPPAWAPSSPEAHLVCVHFWSPASRPVILLSLELSVPVLVVCISPVLDDVRVPYPYVLCLHLRNRRQGP